MAGLGGSNLLTRALSGFAAAAVALACLWIGGTLFWLLVSALALLMLREWCGLAGLPRWKALTAMLLLSGVMLAVHIGDTGRPLVLGSRMSEHAVLVESATYVGPVLLVLIAAVAAALVTVSGWAGAGLLYAGLPAVSLLFLRTGGGGLFGPSFGLTFTLLTLLVVWATDIGAYFAGRAIGGPKLAPRLSPNKTWAGLGGGMACAALVGIGLLAYSAASRHDLYPGGLPVRTYLLYAAAAAVLAILAQGGDLFESWLKRRAGVKDSGQLLPGHGGALDRLDGLVPVAIAMALLMFFGRA